jgi:hypothetical protein
MRCSNIALQPDGDGGQMTQIEVPERTYAAAMGRDAMVIEGPDGRSYEIRRYEAETSIGASDEGDAETFEVWHDGDDLGSFFIQTDGAIRPRSFVSGKIEGETLLHVAREFVARR